ncbi:MAG: heparinase [Chloroflexia bacterium]|nr:heparinase [Chloroflexia bacterium]
MAQVDNLLSGKYTKEELGKLLIPKEKWEPFPAIGNRKEWGKADQQLLRSFFEEAEKNKSYQWPSIPATTALLYLRTGDRDQYQKISFEKRRLLGTFLLAEIYENKGRFIDHVIDGVWSICEESNWGVPAHLGRNGLPEVTKPYVDLFAAETATYLAWVDYFLGEKLDSVSPLIRKRILSEINHRVFNPVMSYHHGWMGNNKAGQRPNNWNPWICSNWLNAALLVEPDNVKRVEMVAKILSLLDEFLNPYPPDGGCDEGPGYWGAAAASLYDNISLLNLCSKSAFAYVFDDEKFRNMGKFIYRAQISEKYFINFADADPQPGMAADMIYRFGKDIRDSAMVKFGAYYHVAGKKGLSNYHYFRNFFNLFIQEQIQSAGKELPLPKDTWLPNLEVMIARDRQGTDEGFFVAAKGGHNNESHNHNDVGNFIVYYDGLPLFIDVGRGTYTSKTFSPRRYEIWYNCSQYHNLPTINGKDQLPGEQYKATNVGYKTEKIFSGFAVDLAKCYPVDAGIISWKRSVILNRNKNVELTDAYTLNFAESVSEHFMTCWPAELKKPGELIIHFKKNAETNFDFCIRYDAAKFSVNIEAIALTAMEDKGVQQKWGDLINRISFSVKSPKKVDKHIFTIEKIKIGKN